MSTESKKALLHKEHMNFLESLAGGDSSTGVPQVAMDSSNANLKKYPKLHAIHIGLTDTLVLSYLAGYVFLINS